MKRVFFKFKTIIEIIEIVENAIDFFLEKQCGVDRDTIFWFMVGFHEILINAYFHGNKRDESLDIEVKVEFEDKLIKAEVKDRGNGFDIDSLPDPTKPENLLKPSGRGILFAKKSCDGVFLKKEKDGFKVQITKKVEG